jgi:hypothetical protein
MTGATGMRPLPKRTPTEAPCRSELVLVSLALILDILTSILRATP